MTDAQLKQDVMDELEFDPRFNATHIGVSVDKQVVSLSGHVESYAARFAALEAAKRVKGVHDIVNHIDVRYSSDPQTSDDQIASRARDILKWNASGDGIDVVVRNGWLTLSGTVAWHYQRKAAEDDVRKLVGVTGVTNSISVEPKVTCASVKKQIEAALKRHAEVEAGAIRVTVNENNVILEGKVDSWDERRAVEDAAWSTAGVRTVQDRLRIG